VFQAKLAQFQSLQKQRRALDSTSDESLHKPTPRKPTQPSPAPTPGLTPQGTTTRGERAQDTAQGAAKPASKQSTPFSTFSSRPTGEYQGEQTKTCNVKRSGTAAENQRNSEKSAAAFSPPDPRSSEGKGGKGKYAETLGTSREPPRGTRERSSSFENIYDGVDLSMYSPSMNEVDWLEFQRLVADKEKDPEKQQEDDTDTKQPSIEERIKLLQQNIAKDSKGAGAGMSGAVVLTPSGGFEHRYQSSHVTSSYSRRETYYQKSVTTSHESSSSSSKTFSSAEKSSLAHKRSFSFDDQKPNTDGPKSPSWYVPRTNEEYEKKVSAAGKHSKPYDAKSLIEEEKTKFEDYKRDFRRRLSERESTSGASGDEGLKDATVAKKDAQQEQRRTVRTHVWR
jgi:hypothetical protein